ncbi:MAG: HEAT repeat domain-containing protein [Planctomycetota bacterium]
MTRVRSFTVLLGVLASCSPQRAEPSGRVEPVARTLPATALSPVLPGLEELAASAPQGPSPERLAELRDLLETGYLPGFAQARSAAMAQRAFGEAEDADWALEDAVVHHEDAAMRAQAAFLLGQRGRKAAIPILMKRVKYEADPVVQSWVAGALAALGCHGALDQLATMMGREDSAQIAGAIAIDVLRAAGVDPGEAPSYQQLQAQCLDLFAAWKRTGVVPSEVPADGSAPAVPAIDGLEPLLRARLAQHLVALAHQPLRPVDDCRFIFQRLGVVGLRLAERCVQASEPHPRNHGLEIMLGLGRSASGVGGAVLPLFDDELTGSVAMRVAGAVGYGEALPYLLDRLGSAHVEIRAAAVAGLGLLGDTNALPALLARLNDPNEIVDVRVEAAAAIARLDVGRVFLLERVQVGDYHEPTLFELLDGIDRDRAATRAAATGGR